MPCPVAQSSPTMCFGDYCKSSNFHLWLNTLSNFLFWFSWLLLWFPASFGSNWWPICSLHDRGPVGEQLDGGEDNAGRHPPTIVTQTHLTPHRPPLKPSWAEWEKESPKRVEHFKSKSHTKSLPSCWGDDRADFYTEEWHSVTLWHCHTTANKLIQQNFPRGEQSGHCANNVDKTCLSSHFPLGGFHLL